MCEHSIVRHGKICFKATETARAEKKNERKKCNGNLFLGAILNEASVCVCFVMIIKCKNSGVSA